MMNHCVPDFKDVEDEFSIPTSSGLSNSRPKRPAAIGEEEIMELLWQNGQVVAQTQKSSKRAPTGDGCEAVAEQREIRPGGGEEEPTQQHLFMQEDEMASWLQYPLDVSSFDRDLYAEFLYSAPPPSTPPITTIAPPRPVVDSRITAPPIQASLRRQNLPHGHISRIPTRETKFQATQAKQQAHSSTSTKKSRAAEVHNLSERRRRDRINEKMKALQELIPRCNKSDKASMLDEAIEYLKSLQLQVQMMSMGCGMVPMMYPGMQQYMPVMGMGMGLGMGMDMSMNRPMVPYPSMLPGAALPNPAAAAAHMSACFPMPAFHLPPVPVCDPSRIQASNQTDPTSNSAVARNPNQPQMPNFNESHQHFLGPHQSPPLPQNQTVVQSISKHPSNSKDIGNP